MMKGKMDEKTVKKDARCGSVMMKDRVKEGTEEWMKR